MKYKILCFFLFKIEIRFILIQVGGSNNNNSLSFVIQSESLCFLTLFIYYIECFLGYYVVYIVVVVVLVVVDLL
jgi:hypothetical protein